MWFGCILLQLYVIHIPSHQLTHSAGEPYDVDQLVVKLLNCEPELHQEKYHVYGTSPCPVISAILVVNLAYCSLQVGWFEQYTSCKVKVNSSIVELLLSYHNIMMAHSMTLLTLPKLHPACTLPTNLQTAILCEVYKVIRTALSSEILHSVK